MHFGLCLTAPAPMTHTSARRTFPLFSTTSFSCVTGKTNLMSWWAQNGEDSWRPWKFVFLLFFVVKTLRECNKMYWVYFLICGIGKHKWVDFVKLWRSCSAVCLLYYCLSSVREPPPPHQCHQFSVWPNLKYDHKPLYQLMNYCID